MKVCLVNSLFDPFNRGGAESVVRNIATGLVRQGDHVFVITLGRDDETEVSDGVKIYRIKSRNIFSFIDINDKAMLFRLLWHIIDMFNFLMSRKVKKIILKENPHVIFTHNLKGLSYLIPKMIKKLGIKHIHTLHDVQLAVPSGLIIKGKESLTFLVRIYQIICRILFNSPNIVISPSQWLLDFYKSKGFFKKSIRIVISNPVINPQDLALMDKTQEKTINLLFIGQVEEHKGIEFLVKVLQRLDNKKYQLKIAGEGSRIFEIGEKTKNNDNIHILGKVEHDDLFEVFSWADCLVVPSLCYENSPSVIGEALMFGIPVIAADIGGAGELIQSGVNGYKFTAGEEKELLKLLKTLNKEKLTLLKKQTHNSVKNLSLSHYLNKVLAIE